MFSNISCFKPQQIMWVIGYYIGHSPKISNNSNWPGKLRTELEGGGELTQSTQTDKISCDTLPNVWCFWNRSLIDNFWGNKFWCAIFAVLGLIRCDHHSVAKVTDSDLIALRICHENVVRLKTKSHQTLSSDITASEYIREKHSNSIVTANTTACTTTTTTMTVIIIITQRHTKKYVRVNRCTVMSRCMMFWLCR